MEWGDLNTATVALKNTERIKIVSRDVPHDGRVVARHWHEAETVRWPCQVKDGVQMALGLCTSMQK